MATFPAPCPSNPISSSPAAASWDWPRPGASCSASPAAGAGAGKGSRRWPAIRPATTAASSIRGIYYKPGSFKAQLCRRGYGQMVEFCREHGIAHDICGKIIVATLPERAAPPRDLAAEGGRQRTRGRARCPSEAHPRIRTPWHAASRPCTCPRPASSITWRCPRRWRTASARWAARSGLASRVEAIASRDPAGRAKEVVAAGGRGIRGRLLHQLRRPACAIAWRAWTASIPASPSSPSAANTTSWRPQARSPGARTSSIPFPIPPSPSWACISRA